MMEAFSALVPVSWIHELEKGDIEIECVNGSQFPYTEVFKLKHPLFATEVFFNPPLEK